MIDAVMIFRENIRPEWEDGLVTGSAQETRVELFFFNQKEEIVKTQKWHFHRAYDDKI